MEAYIDDMIVKSKQTQKHLKIYPKYSEFKEISSQAKWLKVFIWSWVGEIS